MKSEKQSRPILVWIISIIFLLMVLSQICVQTVLLTLDLSSLSPEVRSIIESRSFLDVISPYALATILLISTIQLFRLKKSSIYWLGSFISLDLVLLIRKAITSSWLAISGLKGVVFAFGGVLFFVAVLGYMLWLRKRETLT